tara:strand:- start:2 stop:343 length:342 start_codon:yes stop_codon:yes gene_type:complete
MDDQRLNDRYGILLAFNEQYNNYKTDNSFFNGRVFSAFTTKYGTLDDTISAMMIEFLTHKNKCDHLHTELCTMLKYLDCQVEIEEQEKKNQRTLELLDFLNNYKVKTDTSTNI